MVQPLLIAKNDHAELLLVDVERKFSGIAIDSAKRR
jgi:hypothetical protein